MTEDFNLRLEPPGSVNIAWAMYKYVQKILGTIKRTLAKEADNPLSFSFF